MVKSNIAKYKQMEEIKVDQFIPEIIDLIRDQVVNRKSEPVGKAHINIDRWSFKKIKDKRQDRSKY